jgi:hypothetical protein
MNALCPADRISRTFHGSLLFEGIVADWFQDKTASQTRPTFVTRLPNLAPATEHFLFSFLFDALYEITTVMYN